MPSPIEPFYIEFGRHLHGLRIAKGLTQEQFGRMLRPQMTRASIANIECGKQRVLVHTLVQMAEALHVSISGLLPITDANESIAPLESSRVRVEEELKRKLGVASTIAKELVAKLDLPR